MRRVIPLFLILSLLLLPSCAPADRFEAGHPITKDDLESISAELFTSSDDPSAEETVHRDPNRVYWVKGGSVYHYDPNCRHIKDADSVIEGTFRTAKWSYGIEHACSACGGEE